MSGDVHLSSYRFDEIGIGTSDVILNLVLAIILSVHRSSYRTSGTSS